MGARRPPQPPPPETPSQVLGRTVREQRKVLKLTQAALARHAGVGLAFLYELESGKPTVRLDKVLAVLGTLGLTVTLSLGRPDQRAGTLRSAVPGPAS